MRRSWFVTLLAIVATFAVAGSVLATHTPSPTNTTTSIARGTLHDEIKYNRDGIKVQTKEAVQVSTAEVTFVAGASAGWHSHPGPVFVVVREGTLTVWDETCTRRTYTTGDSFFEAGPDHPLLVKNETSSVARVYATFIAPVGTGPLRIGTEHLCGIAD